MSALTRLSASTYPGTAFAQAAPTASFTLDNARATMWLSQLAYETDDPAKVGAILRAWSLSPVEDGLISTPATSPLPIARAQAILAQRDDLAVLAFGGTDPLVVADWVADFNIAPHDTTTEGFAQALATAMPVIRRRCAGIRVPIVVAGHSLGGALAVLAALELARANLPVAAVYTFGMPRPGDLAFQAAYDARLGASTYRLVYGDDIVPTLAPSAIGFRHVGRLLRQAHGGLFRAEDLATTPGSDEPLFGSPAVTALALRLQAAFAAATTGGGEGDLPWSGRPELVKLLIRALPGGIKDHLPDSYMAALGSP